MRRSKFLQQLSREHHVALKLAKACENAAAHDVSEMCKKALQVFAEKLEPHFQHEERGLPALLDSELSIRLFEEHRLLRESALSLQQREAMMLQAFGRLLAAHVRFEERELFEFIERHLK